MRAQGPEGCRNRRCQSQAGAGCAQSMTMSALTVQWLGKQTIGCCKCVRASMRMKQCYPWRMSCVRFEMAMARARCGNQVVWHVHQQVLFNFCNGCHGGSWVQRRLGQPPSRLYNWCINPQQSQHNPGTAHSRGGSGDEVANVATKQATWLVC